MAQANQSLRNYFLQTLSVAQNNVNQFQNIKQIAKQLKINKNNATFTKLDKNTSSANSSKQPSAAQNSAEQLRIA